MATRLPFTAASAVARAKSQKNYAEKHSNRTRFGVAYGWDGVAWCGVFCWWVFYSLGVDIRKLGISAPVSTNAFDAGAKRIGWQRISKYAIRPGDLIFFDFGDLDGAGPDTANDNDHVGMAIGKSSRTTVRTVEGNTSSGDRGSQANGGGVYLKTRPLSQVRHVYRPPYSTTAQVKALAKQRAAADRAKKLAAAKKKAAKALASKRARAAAAALALALAAGGGTAVVKGGDKPSPKPALTSTPTSKPTVKPSPAKTSKPTAKPKPKPRVTLSRTLRYSKARPLMRGKDVGHVQVLIGFTGKAVDEDFGPKTSAGVKRWERRHGFKQDGVFGRSEALKAGWGFTA